MEKRCPSFPSQDGARLAGSCVNGRGVSGRDTLFLQLRLFPVVSRESLTQPRRFSFFKISSKPPPTGSLLYSPPGPESLNVSEHEVAFVLPTSVEGVLSVAFFLNTKSCPGKGMGVRAALRPVSWGGTQRRHPHKRSGGALAHGKQRAFMNLRDGGCHKQAFSKSPSEHHNQWQGPHVTPIAPAAGT